MVICLEQGADLHMALLMPLPLTVSSQVKSRLVLPFWYRLTWVVPKKGLLDGCVFCWLLQTQTCARSIVNELFPPGVPACIEPGAILDTLVTQLSQEMVDDYPASDPRWAESLPAGCYLVTVILRHINYYCSAAIILDNLCWLAPRDKNWRILLEQSFNYTDGI